MSRHESSAQAGGINSNRSKTRSACDRCHQQKLRCVKASGTGGRSTCERCARLELECRYSPRERRGGRSRPPYRISLMLGPDAWSEPRTFIPAIQLPMPDVQHQQSVTPFHLGSVECSMSSHQGDGGTVIDNAETLRYMSSDARSHVQTTLPDTYPSQSTETLELNSLDCGDGSVLPMVPSHQDMMSGASDSYTFNSIDIQGVEETYNAGPTSAGHSLTSTAGRLTSLNMALYECASKLPSIEPRRVERVGSINTSSHNTNSNRREATLLALDEVFCATNDFINILKSLYLAADQQPTRVKDHSEPNISGSPTSVQPQPCYLDEATTLLFLSCHCRLADIYESIFRAVQHCIDSSFSATHRIAGVILPQLQVGGFGGVCSPALRVDASSPSLPSTTVSMYLTLTMTLSSQLWTQIRDVMKRGGSCAIPRELVAAEMTDSTWDMALRRTNRLSRDIEVIQSSL